MKSTEELKNLKDLSPKDLSAKYLSASKELALLSLQVKVGKENNNAKIKKARKNIARIQTIKQEKESRSING